MGKKIAGTAYVKANGQQIEVKGGAEVPLMDVKRETVMGSGRPAGYKETAIAPYAKLTALNLTAGDFKAITEADDLTITVEFANGRVYTLSDAWVEGEPSYKGEEGETDLEFSGMRGSWA